MIERTDHGINICNQIDEDAYGGSGVLNESDVYNILDQIHTSVDEAGNSKLADLLMNWMHKLHREFPDIVT